MLFKELSQYLLELEKISSRTEMTTLLAELLSKASSHEAYHIAYLVLGTLKANYKPNNQFNLAQKSVQKVLADILDVSVQDLDEKVKESGDLGFAIFSYDWPEKSNNLILEDVFDRLLLIQDISGSGAQSERAAILKDLLIQVDPTSAAFIVRIVLGTMRLGFSDMTFIDALSWMLVGNKSLRARIENAYNVCADLGLITQSLKEKGIDSLDSINIQLGIPIRPASAERLISAQAIIDKLGDCIAQPKLDGFRVQIHLDKSQVLLDTNYKNIKNINKISSNNSDNNINLNNLSEPKTWFFSRNMQDMSQMFPELKQAIMFLPVDSIIIEGEAIVYDEETNICLPFQETVKRKRKHDIESLAQELPLRFYIFDILYINGESTLGKIHKDRRKILVDLINDFESKIKKLTQEQIDSNHLNSIKLIEEKECKNASELINYFNLQIESCLEGLVVKKPEGIYKPGKRDFNWIKLKRQQVGNLNDTIDAVVLGYYFGSGKRAKFGIGAYLAGIYNPEKDTFETIAKVGTGLTDIEWKTLKERADKFKVNSQPTNVICNPDLAPDVWVTPKIVTIILADEITKSPTHTAGRQVLENQEIQEGFALRFPRFEGYSEDKSPTQATTVDEVRKLYNLQYKAKTK